MQKQQYSPSQFEKLFISISDNKNNINQTTFKEQITTIGRMMVWDDSHQSQIFKLAIEVKFFEMLLEVFTNSKDREVINGILGFLSLLLSNLSKETSVQSLICNPCVISLTLTKFGNMNNQVAEYYINFLRALSRKVTPSSAHIFVNKKYPHFPLLMQCARFYNHPQNLVRTTSRNVLLSLIKVQHPKIQQVSTGFPFVTYFLHECQFLKEYWRIIDEIIDSRHQEREYQLDHLDILFQDLQELLFYFDDLLRDDGLLNAQKGISWCFISAFINDCLSPIQQSLGSDKKSQFSIKLVLLVLAVMFKTFSNQQITETLALVTFGKYYTHQLFDCLQFPYEKLISYDKTWKFKGFWDTHQAKVLLYCRRQYHESSQSKQPSQLGLLETFEKKKSETLAIFGVTDNFYEREIQKIEDIFGIPIVSQQNELRKASSGQIAKELLTVIKQEKTLNLQDCETNPVGEAIFSYLVSKDDTLVMLTLNLISNFISNKLVSEELRCFCRLSTKPKTRDFESLMRIENTLTSCLKVFEIDPPCYRVCTYIEAKGIICSLMELFKEHTKVPQGVITALKKAFKVSIQRIEPHFFGGKQWQKCLEIYGQVERVAFCRRPKTLRTYGVIPEQFDTQNNKDSIEFVYENFPQDCLHSIARDLWIYILAKDMFVQLSRVYDLCNVSFLLHKTDNASNKYTVGKPYDLGKDESTEAEYLESHMNEKYVKCEIILLMGYLVLGKENVAQKKSKLEESMILSDKSDPRKLLIKFGDETCFSLRLPNAKLAISLHKAFQQSKSTVLNYRLSEMIKQMEKASQLC